MDISILLQSPNKYYIIAIALLTLLSAFFSGTETAIVSANRISFEALNAKGNKKAKKVLFILNNIEDAIGLILIGNNIANIIATSFITYVATKAFLANEFQILIVTTIQTIIFLLACEVTPKIIARSKADSYLLLMSFPIVFLMYILKPAVKLSLAISNTLKKMLNFKSTDPGLIMSRDEINFLFRLGEQEGLIDEGQTYVSEILSFKDKKAYQVMTPTIDIIAIEQKQSFKDLIQTIYETKFSRIPVYEDRVDNIIGYIFYRDIFKQKKPQKTADLINKAHYIPATKNIYELYLEMQENNLPIVFIVNEYGAVVGMVTHEDIVEELVGEIHTTDHSEESLITRLSDKEFLMDANLDIEFFSKNFNIAIDKNEFETVAGFINFYLAKIPKKGDSFIFKKIKFIIEESTDRSIEKIKIILPNKLKRNKKGDFK